MGPSWLDAAGRAPARSTIVLAHGAVVNGWEMGILRRRFRRLGYQVRQFQYRSMRCGLDENVGRLRDFIAGSEGDVVHVIGHSMGGVLARHVCEKMPDPRPGRLVAIGSPLIDCWVGRRVGRLHARLGPCLTGRTVHDHLSRPSEPLWRGARDFGVLAGTFPFGIGSLFRELPAPSDGVVLWDETRLQGIRDHVTYRLNHFGMLFSRRCFLQMARFLATGGFAEVVPRRGQPPI
jgi:pimeloyl-ACP methyl ester carboxylesterase